MLSEPFTIIDYCFKSKLIKEMNSYDPFGFIMFEYKGIIFTYSIDFACLNCRSVVQDEKYIKDLNDFIDREYESEKRKLKRSVRRRLITEDKI